MRILVIEDDPNLNNQISLNDYDVEFLKNLKDSLYLIINFKYYVKNILLYL